MKDLVKKFQNSQTATTVLIVLLFLLVNWVSYDLFIRFDLSKEGKLRITSASKKILRSLPEQVTVEAFISDDIPDAQAKSVKDLRDFLREYETAANGRINLVFLNPDDDEDAKKRAQEARIQPRQAGQIGQEKTQLQNIYLAVLLSYEDKSEIVQQPLQIGAWEYDLTTRIYKMAHPNSAKVGHLAAGGPFAVNNQNPFLSLEEMSQRLDRLYGEIVSVDTSTEDIPGDIGTLIITTPSALTDLDKFRIDQFVMRGGNLVLAMGGMQVNFNQRGLMAAPIDEQILEFFKQYGVAYAKTMVMDKSSVSFKVPQRQGGQLVLARNYYPTWVLAQEGTINRESKYTQDFQALWFPWAGTMKPDKTYLVGKDGKETAKFDILARTTNQAFTQGQFVVLFPPNQLVNSLERGAQKNLGQFNLAMVVEGKFKSNFADKKPPKGSPRKYLKESEKTSTVLALATPFMISGFDENLQRFDNEVFQLRQINQVFMMNALNIINGMEDLAKATSAKIDDSKPEEIDDWLRQALTASNFMLPLLVIFIIGLLLYLKRKKMAEVSYTPANQEKA